MQPKFKRACAQENVSEALQYGKRIIFLCTREIDSNSQVTTDQRAFYEAVSADVSCQLQRMGVCSLEKPVHQTKCSTAETKTDELHVIVHKLNETVELYDAVSSIVHEQDSAFEQLNRQAQGVHTNIDRSKDQILKYYAKPVRVRGFCCPIEYEISLLACIVVAIFIVFFTYHAFR